MIPSPSEPRPRCLRCWRPERLCYCRQLVPVATATRVVFLQHPRERAAAMGTARLAHLALANSELHVGAHLDTHARVRALADDPSAVLLFPDGDRPAPTGTPRTLVVIDGTWTTAKKMLARTPALRRLPRVGLVPAAPSAYRIRREPAPHCLSTVEAVASALTELEGGGERFAPMLAAFHALVATQVECIAARRAPYRHVRPARRGTSPELAERLARAVVVQVEGNPGGIGVGHELVLIAAQRIATGERFVCPVTPRRPLHPRFVQHTGLAESLLADGNFADAARARWAEFLRPDDVLVGWGTFSARLLGAESMVDGPWLDLRPIAIRRFGRRPGGAEGTAGALDDAQPEVVALGRAGRRLDALTSLVATMQWDDNRIDRRAV